MLRTLLFVSALVVVFSSGDCARILAMYPLGAKSHHSMLQTVAKTLAGAGHEVEVYSPFPRLLGDHPNTTHHHLKAISLVDKSIDLLPFLEEITAYPFWKCLDATWTYGERLYGEFFRDEEIKRILMSSKMFDVIIAEIYNAQEFVSLISHVFKAPVIALQAVPTHNVLNKELGNSLSISYTPDLCTPISDKMTFVERSMNMFNSVRGLFYHYNSYISRMESKMKQEFPGTPPLQELMKSVSLVFVNDHLTADYARPRTPNIIPVGGIHIQPPQPLPQSIKNFMDDPSAGVIFFSLGTYVADDLEPQEYFGMFIHVFKKIKQKVIWKTRKEDIQGLPENVMTLQWAPQKDILAHPACVLFITHSGQNSLLEAIHFGVPVVSIPQFYDQHRNSELFVSKGVGETIPMRDLTEDSLSTTLGQVLGNPRYRENMKKLSARFRDRPLSPAESVVFWTEYVLRHGGAPHLRPASTELRWYQLMLLDVLFFVTGIIFIVVVIIYYVFNKTLHFMCKGKYTSYLFEKFLLNKQKTN